MELLANIAREAIIIALVLTLLGGGGFALLYFRRRIGGGVDDHLRLSENARFHRIRVWLLAITAALWIGVFAVADGEDRGRLTQAVQNFFGFVSDEVEEVKPKEPKPESPRKDLPEIPTR